MKTKNFSKKLFLTKKTIVNLNQQEMEIVLGGVISEDTICRTVCVTKCASNCISICSSDYTLCCMP